MQSPISAVLAGDAECRHPEVLSDVGRAGTVLDTCVSPFAWGGWWHRSWCCDRCQEVTWGAEKWDLNWASPEWLPHPAGAAFHGDVFITSY